MKRMVLLSGLLALGAAGPLLAQQNVNVRGVVTAFDGKVV